MTSQTPEGLSQPQSRTIFPVQIEYEENGEVVSHPVEKLHFTGAKGTEVTAQMGPDGTVSISVDGILFTIEPDYYDCIDHGYAYAKVKVVTPNPEQLVAKP